MTVPLLVESKAYVERLSQAVRAWHRGAYGFRRRVNWSHRYDVEFLAEEASRFLEDPAAYLEGRMAAPPRPLGDVYSRRLSARQIGVVLAKVLLHWAFGFAGARGLRRAVGQGNLTFRKAYVDDIELVFDPCAPGVVRGVFPFPLSVARQRRYLARARREGLRFALCGHRYGLRDLLGVLARRDVGALMRMESRAQLRTARWLVRAGFERFELSDEFDLGSLDFCRALRRHGRPVVNSAHGVGKYLPWHAYAEFWVLTDRQAEYYASVVPCRYVRRTLNAAARPEPASEAAGGRQVSLVWLSQVYSPDARFIADDEARTTARLAQAFGGDDRVKLLYKAHPNHSAMQPPAGFSRLESLEDVNGKSGTLFASFFSTCQIDPAFAGKKVLVRTEVIHPEIAFDASEPIVDAAGLEQLVRGRKHGAPWPWD